MNVSNGERSGFTLIEVLVVLLILTALVSLVGVNVLSQSGEAKVKTTQIQMEQVESALKLYKLEQNRVPTTDQGLEALVRRPERAPTPTRYPEDGYLDGARVPPDAWGNAFIYLAPGRQGEEFELLSYGSDGEPGGSGDAQDLSSSAR